jgi:histidine triad (HIT) family protein
MEEDCVFCKIVRKELPALMIFEDEQFIAFLDIRPLNPGHTLVSPKKHHRWVWDVPEAGRYFETVRMIAKTLQKTMNTEWVVADIGGMGVPHAHVHVIPRFPGDGHGEFVNAQNVKKIPAEEMSRIAEKIRNGFQRAKAG